MKLNAHKLSFVDFAHKTLIPLRKVFGDNFKKGKVVRIDPADKKVILESGEEVCYDILVIATGSGGNFPNKLHSDHHSNIETVLEEYKTICKKVMHYLYL